MNPIQERLTFSEKLKKIFKKKKTINTSTTNPYDTKITQMQVNSMRLCNAFNRMGMSMAEASQTLQINLAEVNKIWTNGKLKN